MYNLLVVYSNETWENGEPAIFDRSRVFEYTTDELKSTFSALDEEAISKITSLPSLFAYEAGISQPARVGRITSVRKRQTEIQITYEFDAEIEPIPAEAVNKLLWELDIHDWEINRTHWAIKDVDLLGELSRARVLSTAKSDSAVTVSAKVELPTPVTAQPMIFRVPSTGIEPDLVSVMRPFEASFGPVQKTIMDACGSLKLRCFDANEVWNEFEIINDIFSLIFRSKVVVCDFSTRNPNVFYEAGIAHTLGRAVIPIVQNEADIPFDLRHHRYIKYLNNGEGLAKLATELASRLATLVNA